jgi:glyoxylase-like metal-dependent hydrolase (beta-lactamase superfamily II)
VITHVLKESMQELANHIYIETGYAGVTLGAINWAHGLILIDAPFRQEDARLWRTALLNLGGGVDRLLVNLDAHFDRTLGVRAMECTVVGHEKMAEIFRNRPVTFKTQGTETGAEWELYNGLGSIRWVPPDITFTEGLKIHWDDSPLLLESRPGPATGAIWAVLPDQRIAFVGDALVPDQPPYLSSADLPTWINSLRPLLTAEYQDYLLISGRGGPVAHQQVRRQLTFLEKTNGLLEDLARQKAPASEAGSLSQRLIQDFEIPAHREMQYRQRLQHGLQQYYIRHYQPTEEEITE